jgi:hypothetical protein
MSSGRERIKPGDFVTGWFAGSKFNIWKRIIPNDEKQGCWIMSGEGNFSVRGFVIAAPNYAGALRNTYAVLVLANDAYYWTWSHELKVTT